jgi:hypothetical protein
MYGPASERRIFQMAKEWVEFKRVKDSVSMQMVLDRYGVKGLTQSGDELRGACPIHKGSLRSKNFTVNLRKNAFNCFSKNCKARGNVLDFVALMEHCEIRDAALHLAEWFKVGECHDSSDNDQPLEREKVLPGIYRDHTGAQFEVITTALSGEDSEPLVVYRELFGEYRYWVAPIQNFGVSESYFNLEKRL